MTAHTGVTARLAEFCATIEIERLPPEVVERTRYLTLDLAGNMVRARHVADSAPSLLSAAAALGFGTGRAHVFGDTRTYSAAGAAFINATLAHSLDFDDTHAPSTLHPGAPVIPAVFAAAEMVNASGADALAAIVAGYEVTCRVALALPAGDHYQRGFHPTATCGVFGATAAAGRLFKLDAEQIASALGIALSQSAGSLQFLENGAWTKRFQVGWASMSGLTAATLAREGFKGACDAIEGRLGFLNAYAPHPNPGRVNQDLGEVFELMATGVKPYPSCRYGHAGIDAALELRSEYHLIAEQIEKATYGLSKAGMLLVGAPAEKKNHPRNVVDAQFSAPFVIASALATGRMSWDSYGQLSDPALRDLIGRVHCEFDPEIEAEFPANMSGRLAVHARGEVFTRKIVVPKGEPGNFLSVDELLVKFTDLAQPVMGSASAEHLAAAILEFDRLSDMRALFDHTVRAA